LVVQDKNMLAMIKMWNWTEMVVLTAVTAAFYAAAEIMLAPLSPVLLPGVTGFRLSNVFPLLLGMVFGPAGSWGAGVGNLIGDFFLGGLGLGSIFGFISSCSVGFVGYTAGRLLFKPVPDVGSRTESLRSWVAYSITSILGAAVCGVLLAWGLALLKIAPFSFVCDVVFINLLLGNLVGCSMVRVVDRRAKAMNLSWTEIMGPAAAKSPRYGTVGLALVAVGSVCGLLLGNSLSPDENLLAAVGICIGFIMVGSLLL
jgi:energy-coupling factor transport system substrate-specific component